MKKYVVDFRGGTSTIEYEPSGEDAARSGVYFYPTKWVGCEYKSIRLIRANADKWEVSAYPIENGKHEPNLTEYYEVIIDHR